MKRFFAVILIMSLLFLPSLAFASQQTSGDPSNVKKVKLKLDKNNNAVYNFNGGSAEIQIEDGPIIQVKSRYKKVLEDGTEQTVDAPTTVNIRFVPYDKSSSTQAAIMATEYTDWDYLGYYSIIDRPTYYVGGQGAYISANLAMEVHKYRDASNNTTMAYAVKETRNYYTRSSTSIGAYDFKIKTYQYGVKITDGIPGSYSYSPANGSSGSSYTTLSWGTTYTRNATSSGFSAYSGWIPVIINLSAYNLKHSNSFTYTYNNNYQGVIDEDNCELAVKTE